MAYKLAFNTTSRRVDLANDIDVSGDFEIEFKIDFDESVSVHNLHTITRASDGTDTDLLIRRSDKLFIIRAEGASEIRTNLTTMVSGTYKVVNNATDGCKIYLDDVEVGSRSYFTQAFKFGSFGSGQGNFRGDLYYFKTTVNGVVTNQYIPSASGSTLIDSVGSNNGTLVNFPTDDSQWVYYDDGSSSFVDASASSAQTQSLSASASVTSPAGTVIGYGNFIYGHGAYSTQQYGEDLASAVITSSASQSFDVIRIRQIELTSASSTAQQSTADKIKPISTSQYQTSSSSIAVSRERLFNLGMQVNSTASGTADKIKELGVDIASSASGSYFAQVQSGSSQSEQTAISGYTAYGEIIRVAQSEQIAESISSQLAGVIYYANIDMSQVGNFNANLDILYTQDSKDNETYSTIVKGSDLYTVQTKQNENYEVI